MIENMCTIGLIALAAAAGLIVYRFMIVAKDDFNGYAAGFLLSMVGIVLFVSLQLRKKQMILEWPNFAFQISFVLVMTASYVMLIGMIVFFWLRHDTDWISSGFRVSPIVILPLLGLWKGEIFVVFWILLVVYLVLLAFFSLTAICSKSNDKNEDFVRSIPEMDRQRKEKAEIIHRLHTMNVSDETIAEKIDEPVSFVQLSIIEQEKSKANRKKVRPAKRT